VNSSAEGFADYGVAIDPDRNWLASVMERAQRTINILHGPRANTHDVRYQSPYQKRKKRDEIIVNATRSRREISETERDQAITAIRDASMDTSFSFSLSSR